MNSFPAIDEHAEIFTATADGKSVPGHSKENASSVSCEKKIDIDQDYSFVFEESVMGKLFISDILY